MGYFNMFVLVLFSWSCFIQTTHGLQTYQIQLLLQIRKHLEYPSQLQALDNYYGDLCNLSATAHVMISCQDNFVTELKIRGDKLANISGFNGYAIPNKTLSETFSIDSLVITLTRLTSLRVLSLVSLGIWGPLPDKIHRLYSLELLDLSSNLMYGSIPPQISRMVKLQTLTLDGNYFNDTIPDNLDSLSNLTVLSLRGNRLKGQFPSSICRISSLTDIALCHNKLSGKLPDLSSLTSLRVLDLRENQLDSKLPVMPQGLVTALLAKNLFSGEIPGQFGTLSHLQHLDLSFNHLTGTPPSALFDLQSISYLNLASNTLSGSLPERLTCGSKLGFVDISNNKLVGELPSCLDDKSDKRVVKFGRNCLSIDGQQQHQGSHCKEANTRKSGRKIAVLVAAIVGSVLLLVLLAFGFLILSRRCFPRRTFETRIWQKAVQDSPTNGVSSEVLANAGFISKVVKLGVQGAPVCRLFSLEELKEATNSFDSSMLMGESSTGKLYKGRLENGTYVAIRSLTLLKKYSSQNLKVRLDFFSKLHHPHLVGLLGHCIDGGVQDDSSANKVFLVYDYMSNGNYRMHLSENCPEKVLKWSDRLAILIDMAKAVNFLHTGVIPGVYNNQLKTNNILLDEHHIAKLSDYGMSIIMEENEKLEAKGEGLKSSQSKNLEDDVYDFGFILLESLVGPIVNGKGETFLLNEMGSFDSQDGRKQIVDPTVLTTCSQESLSIVVSITGKCICPEPSSRPSFEDVLWNLRYAAQVQAAADADQNSEV
ncbi:probable inactive leucine-rich repeat receptor-like protein kinase At3g03770 [Durio zibethinus]|uniref:Probable inactive leucine-rich repeat receptor-like protein kinase At3g03770 n=1 Tax=Durio zibethinus TaxID=66656 RepID=A0A6P5ZDD4_DURZI|nr:probable inactive leucine-rich repeat receptor-like protein kinase At3g03770 [Durio zibethinus]XP_022750485.1 probable inactive leucine-rich repeat receptor-like protein kinase At3g03770 [Durio zibethinus]